MAYLEIIKNFVSISMCYLASYMDYVCHIIDRNLKKIEKMIII